MTFLFTDVEGSTSLWATDQQGMTASLELHDSILRETVESEGGYVFTTAGDGFAVAFTRASDALAAASNCQQKLASAEWPGPALRVRMGLHLGEAQERLGDYFGPVVNLTARLESVAHGGQVVMTDLVRAAAGVDAIDLGLHPLRDVPEPVQVFQLGGGAFPPLRSSKATRTNLPAARSRLIGRAEVLKSVRASLGEHRLVTLTAGGGTGKTRLALAIGEAELTRRAGGVWFADLLTVSEESQVPVAVAAALGLTLTTGDHVRQIVDFLEPLGALVILDNCEHVVDACADLVEAILERPGSSVVIATSREFLDVEGERAIRLLPLDLDRDKGPAVELFMQRAAANGSTFDSEAERQATADLCRRLDGLPLAIELAAARCGVMTPAELLAGISERFELLGGGRRRRSRRTLEDAFEWSYDLLDPEEQHMFRHLGVFVGDFEAVAAAQVADLDLGTTVDLLDALHAKSMVVVDQIEGSTRFHLLETARVYSEGRLAQAGEASVARDRHLDHHLSTFEPFCDGAAFTVDLQAGRAIVSPGDVQAALDWACRGERWADVITLAAGAVDALRWDAEKVRSTVRAALERLDRRELDAERLGLGLVIDYSVQLDDWEQVRVAAARAIESPDRAAEVLGRIWTAWSTAHTDTDASLRETAAAASLAQEVADGRARNELLGVTSVLEAWMHEVSGRPEQALEAALRSRSHFAASGRQPQLAVCADVAIATCALLMGRVDAARELVTERAVDSFWERRDMNLALVHLAAGDLPSALPHIRAHTTAAVTKRLSREANDALLLLAQLANAEGDDELARRLVPEIRQSRSWNTIALTHRLADALGVRSELDAASAELPDRNEMGRRALALLRSELDRRGWLD